VIDKWIAQRDTSRARRQARSLRLLFVTTRKLGLAEARLRRSNMCMARRMLLVATGSLRPQFATETRSDARTARFETSWHLQDEKAASV
jgi:hypothetical protein